MGKVTETFRLFFQRARVPYFDHVHCGSRRSREFGQGKAANAGAAAATSRMNTIARAVAVTT